MPAKAPRILLRVDANGRVGMGHAVRLAALVDMLRPGCELHVAGSDATLRAAFPQLPLHPLDSEDFAGLREVLDAVKPQLVIVDLPPTLPRPWQIIREWGRVAVAALDDEGGALDADLVINGTVLEQYHHYQCPAATRILCGTEYTLIRPAFARHPWRGAQNGIAIVIGSGERAEAWALMLASGAVDMSSWGEVTMVVGGSFKPHAELAAACQDAGIALRQGLSGEALAELLSCSAIALITGGMVVYEALATGTPAVVFPQVPNLIPEAAWFAAHGAIVDLKYDGGMDAAAVERAVGELLENPSAARTMSEKQRAIVDGRGMERAAAAIDSLLDFGMMQ